MFRGYVMLVSGRVTSRNPGRLRLDSGSSEGQVVSTVQRAFGSHVLSISLKTTLTLKRGNMKTSTKKQSFSQNKDEHHKNCINKELKV